jgi:hypothetical protein
MGAPRGARMPAGENPAQPITIQLKENEDITSGDGRSISPQTQ